MASYETSEESIRWLSGTFCLIVFWSVGVKCHIFFLLARYQSIVIKCWLLKA